MRLARLLAIPPPLVGAEPQPRSDDERLYWRYLYERHAFGHVISDDVRDWQAEQALRQFVADEERTRRYMEAMQAERLMWPWWRRLLWWLGW